MGSRGLHRYHYRRLKLFSTRKDQYAVLDVEAAAQEDGGNPRELKVKVAVVEVQVKQGGTYLIPWRPRQWDMTLAVEITTICRRTAAVQGSVLLEERRASVAGAPLRSLAVEGDIPLAGVPGENAVDIRMAVRGTYGSVLGGERLLGSVCPDARKMTVLDGAGRW
ncbi:MULTISPECIES: hypothetical protein [Bacteria]|uniref:hypothetical protein n=1 Tax=Bacteria TaxID=2 RepID=UPI003C7E8104